MLTYAEIHYRLPFVPSLINTKFPEIVCDTPSRVQPGQPVPLFIFIKDAHRHPVRIIGLTLHAVYESGRKRVAVFPYRGLPVAERFWWDSVNFLPEETGLLTLVPVLEIAVGKRRHHIMIDSYRGSTKQPLEVLVAESSLPTVEGWYHGDMHVHSLLTSDQVEFGAPSDALSVAAWAMGLDWFALADHSYDLDDSEENYLVQDPALPKWIRARSLANIPESAVTIIPGEEVSCRTTSGRNCHMLALDTAAFIPGSGDSGERGLDNRSELSTIEAAALCRKNGGFSCAAHPLERVSLAERLILNRGKWEDSDLANPDLGGIQIYNGVRDRGFRDGKAYWKAELLKGRKLPIFGGSDAHGDMNRQWSVSIPFLSITERDDHRLGSVRTIVRAQSNRREDILEALKHGQALVSDGPFIDMTARAGDQTAGPGDSIDGKSISLDVTALSSKEFGNITKIIVYAGLVSDNREIVLSSDERGGKIALTLEKIGITNGAAYVRAECETDKGALCLTNPLWLSAK